jgi:hypothetical protein
MIDLLEVIEPDREGHRMTNLAKSHRKTSVCDGEGPWVVLAAPEKSLLRSIT